MKNKSPEVLAAMKAAAPFPDNVKPGSKKCPTCDADVGEFRDALSAKEFSISGMCQACQDSVFGGE